MTIEVDGWQYDKENKTQESRDMLKDEILGKYGLKPWRISTVDVIDVKIVKNRLGDIDK
jgi:very-short-patch-repair endonuclease